MQTEVPQMPGVVMHSLMLLQLKPVPEYPVLHSHVALSLQKA
jgi:hypothetical protein